MKAVILDFGTGIVRIVPVESVGSMDIEKELAKKGYIDSDCVWMAVEKLKIIEE